MDAITGSPISFSSPGRPEKAGSILAICPVFICRRTWDFLCRRRICISPNTTDRTAATAGAGASATDAAIAGNAGPCFEAAQSKNSLYSGNETIPDVQGVLCFQDMGIQSSLTSQLFLFGAGSVSPGMAPPAMAQRFSGACRACACPGGWPGLRTLQCQGAAWKRS